MIKLEEISKHSSTDWYVEHAPANPIILSGIAKGFSYKLNPREYSIILCYFEKGEMDWITLIQDQNKIGELIFKKHKENKNYWKKEFKKYLKIRIEIENNFRRLKDKDISKISDKEFLREFKKYTEFQLRERRISNSVDPFNFYSERKLNNDLRKFKNKNPNLSINIAGEILTRPNVPSFLNEVELELIKIAKEVSKDKLLKDKFTSKDIEEKNIKGTKIYNAILNHLNRYYWIKGSFCGWKEYTFKDVSEHIGELLKNNLKKEIKKNQLWKENNKIKKKYISRYKFNKEILSVVEISSVFAKLQDLRKESTLINAYLQTKFLKELSKRKKTNENDLVMLADYSEIKDFINKKIDKSILKKRKKGCLIVFKKDQFRIFYKHEINSLMKKIINTDVRETKEIVGIIASSGRARGRTRIVITERDASLFKKGEILVSTMTRPEHIMAMKKAAAIVTNEGGITCHAAIVSRELGIPCIIGTKIATRVLKDGDLVEVNANKGVIRIIK